ncbi:DUF1156 domain-containing protein, partial [Endozoicomonas sp. ONNA1]|uniref:DUF1156 domain-containing protein n=1 Tax=Endozoicomonas sp. ONNA1 TaxID=2828740 RepID=UPI0021481248
MTTTELKPLALKDAPALIEAVFPAQKVSFEAQRERKAGSGQTLTALGSYWKGRKPLILVRAIVLGSLLPQTDDVEKDLEIFELLMGFDDEGLARRAFMKKSQKPYLSVKDIALRITLDDPWSYFTYKLNDEQLPTGEENHWTFPLDVDAKGISIRWRRGVTNDQRVALYHKALKTFENYEEKALLCRRPEELDQQWLYSPIWRRVNQHLDHLGINASSHQELVEQLGILRYGRRPRVGDTFSGGGSLPFEAARLGCEVYASDLNPIACMLTWGAINIIGAPSTQRSEIEQAQKDLADAVDQEITDLGIEHCSEGHRAKAFLYCLEVICPETGWLVPLATSWIISKSRSIVAKLVPVEAKKCFDIRINSHATAEEMEEAEKGTVRSGNVVYKLHGKAYSTPIKTLRGDYKDKDGQTRNKLRLWEKHEFKPRHDDIFQERLYAIQWIHADTLTEPHHHETFYTPVREEDYDRELQVTRIVEDNLFQWQKDGFIPDTPIETGDKTDEPIKTRGWTHWHHLFTPRNLLVASIVAKRINKYTATSFCELLNFNSKLCRWTTSQKRIAKDGSGKQVGGASENSTDVFSNQALNTFYNFAHRSLYTLKESMSETYHDRQPCVGEVAISSHNVVELTACSDIWITDPPPTP